MGGKYAICRKDLLSGCAGIAMPPAITISLLIPFILALDMSAIFVALPSAMHNYLDDDSSRAALFVIVYFLAMASTVMIWGRLADRFSVKTIVLLGACTFLVGAIGAADQEYYVGILAFRTIEGLGAAMLMSAGLVMLVRSVAKPRVGRLQRWTEVAASVGSIIGALAGGLVCESLTWRAVLLLPVPVVLVLIYETLRWRPSDKRRVLQTHSMNPDFFGAILLFLWLGPLVFCFNQGDEMQWTSPVTINILVFAVLFFTIWLFFENRSRHPLIDVRLLRQARPLRNLTLLLGTSVLLISGSKFMIPVYLQQSQKCDPTDIGLVLVIFPLTRLVVSLVTGMRKDCGNTIRFMQLGSLLIILCYFGLFLGASRSDVLIVGLFLMVLATGASLLLPTITTWLMQQIPEHQKGMMAGLYQTVNMLGYTLGVGIFEAFYASTNDYVMGCRFACLFAVTICLVVFGMVFSHNPTLAHTVTNAE